MAASGLVEAPGDVRPVEEILRVLGAPLDRIALLFQSADPYADQLAGDVLQFALYAPAGNRRRGLYALWPIAARRQGAAAEPGEQQRGDEASGYRARLTA